MIAQYLGAGREKQVRLSIHTALTVSILLGMVLTVLFVLCSPVILRHMNTPTEVLSDSIQYLTIFSCGLLFNVVYNMCTGILNATGNSRRPPLYLAISSITNILLDLLLVKELGMGVRGAAISTTCSQFLSCILILLFLHRVPECFRLSFRELKIHPGIAGQMIRIGFPAALQNIVISFSNLLVQSSVNSFGAKAMGGFGVYMKVDGFNILPVTSLSMAITTFTAQNYGAGHLNRIKKGIFFTLSLGMVYTLLTGFLLVSHSTAVMHLFTPDSQIVHYGQLAMVYFCPFYFLLSILHTLASALRGVGNTVAPTVILLFSLCVFRILWVQLILPHLNSISGIYLLYPVSWAFGTILMVLYTRKENMIQQPHKKEAFQL